MPQRRLPRLLLVAVLPALLAAAAAPAAVDAASEQQAIAQWRAQRVQSLTSDGGWLTLAGLLWLSEGSNTFGRAQGNALVLEHRALAERAGTFEVSGTRVRFVSAPGAHVTHAGRAVEELELSSDAH